MKKGSAIKITGAAALAIIALYLLKAILFPMRYGMYVSYRMPTHMSNSYNYSYSINNFGGAGTLLLALLIKVLLILFIIVLLVGLMMLVKNNLFTQEHISFIKGAFVGKVEKTSKVCTECDSELNEHWKVCPYCGNEVNKL